MRLGLPSLLVRPAAPPLKWGLVVAASLIMAETLVLYPLKRIAFENTLGVVAHEGSLRCSHHPRPGRERTSWPIAGMNRG
jgi:hypothetical protein